MDAETRYKIQFLEDKLMALAEENGMIKRRQDDFQKWVHEHEKRELTMHNEVLTAVNSIGATMELLKAESEKKDQAANSRQAKRKDAFDRALRVVLFIIALIVGIDQLYNWAGRAYTQFNSTMRGSVKEINK